MGGPNKLLLPYGGTTVIGAVVRALLRADLDLIVVTGRDADEVAAAARPAPTVFNPAYERGLGTSIATGVRSVPVGDHVLVALGDMPGLRPEVVRSLVERAAADRIVVPAYADEPATPGHPVLFGSRFRAELEGLTGDAGARRVLAEHPEALVTVHVPGSLKDLDTPQSSNDRPVE
jgi:molybdenum cofactor cytidylyltransferase